LKQLIASEPPEAAPEPRVGRPLIVHGVPRWLWLILFLGLSLFVAYRLDVFDVWTTVTTADGVRVRMPAGYATVDHPFHTTRAETLRRSLADGHLLRWIGHHQGGYPVEFYPLGVPAVEVGLWGLALGALPMAAIHKITVALFLLLPAVGFWLLARGDRLSPGIALIAITAHVAINGWWWSGGYMELVLWGLITNVAAYVMLLFVLFGVVASLHRRSTRAAALAAMSAAFAIYSNPRTLFALAIIGIGAALTAWWDGSRDGASVRRITGRLALIGVTAALVALPELLSLIRFRDLYYFVHYSSYTDVRNFLHYWVQTVSGPVFVAGLIGWALALIRPGRPFARTTAVVLALYVAMTALLSSGGWLGQVAEQLEPTRLMPFQRLLTIYLAALAVADILAWLLAAGRSVGRLALDGGLVAIAGLVLLLYVLAPPSFIPVSDRGLYAIPTSAAPAIADLKTAVEIADQQAAPGTALLVLGSTVSWHDQLWAPFWSSRPFFYNDWLWYWQTRNYGPYNPTIEHAYPDAAAALTADYFEHHGIGAVIVTGEAAPAAATSPLLQPIRAGFYSVYLVRRPTTIVTANQQNAVSSDIGNQHLSAQVSSDGGTARIRRNWFPRWTATVNGHPTPITETEDGYMTVPIPAGDARISLTYAVDGWDWVGRVAAVLGLAIIAGLLLGAGNRATLRGVGRFGAHGARRVG
jgi:hypothetical protein